MNRARTREILVKLGIPIGRAVVAYAWKLKERS